MPREVGESGDRKLAEPILADDYPVYAGYLYVADGEVVISDIEGTALRLKRYLGASELRRCDMAGRRAAIASSQGAR